MSSELAIIVRVALYTYRGTRSVAGSRKWAPDWSCGSTGSKPTRTISLTFDSAPYFRAASCDRYGWGPSHLPVNAPGRVPCSKHVLPVARSSVARDGG
jgi:hypothetical protein